MFDVIARAYLSALMPDFRYRQTTATLDVRGFEFRAAGRQPIDLGWRAAFPEWQPADEKGDERSCCRRCATARPRNCTIQ
jgi:DNA topoisomerase-3